MVAFIGIIFTGVIFTGVIFTGIVFTRVIFTRIIFTGIVFTGVIFTRIVFTGIVFTGIILTRIIFSCVRVIFARSSCDRKGCVNNAGVISGSCNSYSSSTFLHIIFIRNCEISACRKRLVSVCNGNIRAFLCSVTGVGILGKRSGIAADIQWFNGKVFRNRTSVISSSSEDCGSSTCIPVVSVGNVIILVQG
ncbi:MAG: pentapeptide repeat-containing protein [Ruminococcus sp.]|nr:pentapeptide repeat-containing protein [Ruminococcus sp.]